MRVHRMLSQPFERYRHVVFVDTLRGGRATNLTPRPAWPVAPLICAPPVETHQHPDGGGDVSGGLSAGQQLDPDQERFVRWLFRKVGLDARHYREETLRRR